MKGLVKKTLAFLAAAVVAFCLLIFANNRFHSPLSSDMTPWAAVGGCGAGAGGGGGGGGSGGAQLKWIGQGVSGTLFDCEVISGIGVQSDSSIIEGSGKNDGRLRIRTTSMLVSLYYHPPKILDIKLAMPFLFKQGKDVSIGPFGDLSLDLTRKWGVVGNISTAVTLIFPTGYASLTNDGAQPLEPEYQLGGGLFGSSLRASYTFDMDWGIINLGGTYSTGLFNLKTTDYNVIYARDSASQMDLPLKVVSSKQQFAIARDGFGARNDAGVTTPDFIGIFTDFGLRTEPFTHGFSINFSYPFSQGKREIRQLFMTDLGFTSMVDAQQYLDTVQSLSHVDTSYLVLAPTTDGTNRWSYFRRSVATRKTPPTLSLQYTVEKSDMAFPILIGGMLFLDYEDRLMFSGFSFGVGLKFPVY
jgi:hypothetical protein